VPSHEGDRAKDSERRLARLTECLAEEDRPDEERYADDKEGRDGCLSVPPVARQGDSENDHREGEGQAYMDLLGRGPGEHARRDERERQAVKKTEYVEDDADGIKAG